MIIELSKDEIETAAIVGIKRHLFSSGIGRKDHTNNPHNFQSHIIGAVGEYAVCKVFGRHWDIITTGKTLNKNDMSGSKKPIDIKTSGRKRDDVLINQSTPPKRYAGFVFIFCMFCGNSVEILGWIETEKYFDNAKLKTIVKGRKPCWSMDIDKLNKITPAMVEQYKKTRS